MLKENAINRQLMFLTFDKYGIYFTLESEFYLFFHLCEYPSSTYSLRLVSVVEIQVFEPGGLWVCIL